VTRLAAHDPVKAELVELRFFAGMPLVQSAACLDVSLSSAARSLALHRRDRRRIRKK
jgi:hypothetical protein